MALIIDPDDLNQGTEVTIDTNTRRITLNIAGNLSTDGVTLKALYSFLKEEWKTDAALIKFPFPMVPITDEQFELVNDWNFFNLATQQLVRNAGWAVVGAGATFPTERWAGVITLGFIEGDDQVYYTQVDSTTATTTDFALTGPVNQAVQIWSDPNADGNPVDGFDRTGFLKLWLREWDQAFDDADLTDIGVTTMTYQAYRFPLTTTSDDPKVTEAENDVATMTPWTDVDMEFIEGHGFTVWMNATVYDANYVVQSSTDGRWYVTAAGGTSSGDDTDLAGGSDTGVTWVSYTGERQIGANWYPFNWIIDANVDDIGTGQSAEDVYMRIQWSLRQATDIDQGAGVSNGKTTKLLLNFIGDDLFTTQSVYIDDFDPADTNRLHFQDANGVFRQFPFTATLTINFGANLVNDPEPAMYWVFFTNDDAGDNAGNDYGTSGAILVDDFDGFDMTGNANVASVTRTYDYDNNIQRGAGSAGTDAPITAVAIGLTTGQFVTATGTIARTTANVVSLVAALERNYENP